MGLGGAGLGDGGLGWGGNGGGGRGIRKMDTAPITSLGPNA